jgi:nucleoid-associated protein YgaU
MPLSRAVRRTPLVAPATRAALAALVAVGVVAAPARAQRRVRFPSELRGSKESVQRMWDFAQDHRLAFFQTPREIGEAVADGRLVPLAGDSTYELSSGVGFAYATREARQFVLAFAPQYAAACGKPLVVTSAARPATRQPRNSNPYSVHPTGIAVDLRRPPAGPCQRWLRSALAELEDQGYVEATEEHRPVHLHVAVLTAPGSIAALPPLVTEFGAARRTAVASVRLTSRRAASSADGDVDDAVATRTYRVRAGDSLWEIAERSGVSVSALARANRRSQRAVLAPGTILRIPAR